MSEESKIRDVVDAARGLAEVVPIYQDALQPAAKEIGKTLKLPVRVVNAALKPLEKLVWKWEQIWEYTEDSLTEKLKNVPEENIITPSPIIAVPTLEALRYSGHEPNLREMYTTLLATSMDSRTVIEAHPSFVEIIKQIIPDEALIIRLFLSRKTFPLINVGEKSEGRKGSAIILRNFGLLGEMAQCNFKELLPNYLDNLSRLGLVNIDYNAHLTAPNIYDNLEQHPRILELKWQLEQRQLSIEIQKGYILVTDLGNQFIKACIPV